MSRTFPPSLSGGLALLLLATLVACGPAPAVSLRLSSSSATVLRGASVTVDVTLTRSGGASGDVVLSTDLPASADVTANFASTTLTGSILTSTLTLDVGAGASEGPVAVTVAADGGGLAASQTFTLSVASRTANGVAVGVLGSPLAGVSVASQGVSAVTAADGTFTLAGLSVPYDVTLSSTADGWAHVFAGLTVPDPELMPFAGGLVSPVTPLAASLSGTVTGASVPVAAGHTLVVCAESLSAPMLGSCDRLAPSESTYAINPNWFGPSSVPVRIHALEYAVDGDNLPTAYGGYATAEVTLNGGGSSTADITLGAAPATTTLSGSIVAPVGVTTSTALIALRISPTLDMLLTSFTPSGPISVPVPDLPDATADVTALGTAAGGGQVVGWRVGATGAFGTLTLPTPVVPVTPVSGSTGVTTDTSFEIANPSGGLMTLLWRPAGAGAAPSLGLTTAGTTATIPDVPGMALPAATTYDWSALVATGFDSVDAGGRTYLEDYFRVILGLSAGGPGQTVTGGLVSMAGRPTFTTAP